jgi:AcrR family transcriptional regulator
MSEAGPDAYRAARRRSMASNADNRAVRTRAALSRAVEETVQSDPDAVLTAAGLCTVAGVTRSAFYSHFADVDDLLVWMVAQAFEPIAESDVARRGRGSVSGWESTNLVIRDVIAEIRSRPAFFRRVLTDGRGSTVWRIVESVAARTARTLASVAGTPQDVDLVVTSRFLAGGVVAVIASAVAYDSAMSDDELVAQIVALFPAWLIDG